MTDADEAVGVDASTDGQSDQNQSPKTEQGILDKVPEWVVPLGGGFLLAATLITVVMTIVMTYLILTANFTGPFSPLRRYASRLWAVELKLLLATGFQSVGTYFAWQRTHWGVVLITCLLGSFVVLTIPFLLPAFILLGLGKRHFSLNTPANLVQKETP